MRQNIREYAVLGLVHHLLYPKCVYDALYHFATLGEFVRRDDIETFDCCIPFEEPYKQKAIEAVKGSGKEVVYSMHIFPARKISLGSDVPEEQKLIRLYLEDQIAVAAAMGAKGFVFASGADVPAPERPVARENFRNVCKWLCSELGKYGIIALLEPFDREFDKKFLYGPTSECMELIKSLQPDIKNMGIELDIAHLPLMGESFETAFVSVAPKLKRIHIGNCVMKNPSSKWYGDIHPPVGFSGGEIDIPQLTEVLRLALDIGYLDKLNRGALVLEMQSFPDKTVEETIRDSIKRLECAWKLV
ncbi:MAG: sugar phosphate isomerase/epimerase [Verrucomicrobia bacterium]|nr:sugar phosphate isomerase/epimerase [Verrucomicrobiota bacterium]MBU1733646.1 sugar phosphate isomerase/epimerase [Verrucomicrobiota bacterium]MBU1856724.1 sugar phosphate isomerase/epimerase [Verrucomicrobiota bacterium]